MLENSPNKKFLPEIEIAVLFIAIVVIGLMTIIGFLAWNGYANRKMESAAHQVTLQYNILNDQYQRMQHEYVSVKACIDSISAAVMQINLICTGPNPSSPENSAKINALKQKIQENKLTLGCDIELLKLNFGAQSSIAVKDYMDSLAKILAASDSCTMEKTSLSEWGSKSEEVNNKLSSSMNAMADKLTQILQKTTPAGR